MPSIEPKGQVFLTIMQKHQPFSARRIPIWSKSNKVQFQVFFLSNFLYDTLIDHVIVKNSGLNLKKRLEMT